MDSNRNFQKVNVTSPIGSSPPVSIESGAARGGPPKMSGLHGIKSIHTRVAKGPTIKGRRDVFNEQDHLKEHSIDSGIYENQEDVSGAGVSIEHKLLNGVGSHDLGSGKDGLKIGTSPFKKNGHIPESMYRTGIKPTSNGPEYGTYSNGVQGYNTTTGKNRMNADFIHFQLAQGLIQSVASHKSKPGDLLANNMAYDGQVDLEELPETALDALDYTKRLRFEELKKTRLDAMCNWKKKDVRGIKKNAYIKEIQKKNNKILTKQPKDALEQLEVATDRFPLLKCRKAVKKVLILIQMLCFRIISTNFFENFTIFVIISNSAVMVVDDPSSENPDFFFVVINHVFNALYTVEMVLKIMGLGFILGENAYLRDSWNILDFVIVMSAIPPYLGGGDSQDTVQQEVGVRQGGSSGAELSALRSFRVMRPLRTITSIKGLKVLITALFAAVPLLRDTLLILIFFFIVFSIACLQLLAGSLKQRCVSIQNGKVHPDDILCGSGVTECPGGYFCGKQNANPNYGVTNFDSIQYSLLNVFQCVTLEGWSDIQVMMQKTFASFIYVLFITMILLGAFFLLNLLLAVINSKFTEAHNEHQVQEAALKLKKAKQGVFGDDDEMDQAIQNKDEMTISQFITARIYAKKMRAFLRKRKEQRAAELLRQEAIKKKRQASQQARRNIPGQFNGSFMANGNGDIKQNMNNIIMEDEQEHHDEVLNEEEKHLQQVQDLLQNSKITMQRDGRIVRDLKMPMSLNQTQQKTLVVNNPIIKGGAPTLMGNIGPNKNKYLNPVTQMDLDVKQKKLFSKMAEEFDIDKVIPKAHQKNEITNDIDDRQSINSFDLSINYDNDSKRPSSRGNIPNSTMDGNGFKLAVGHNKQEDNISGGLITSDSDFEQAAQQAGNNPQNQLAVTKRNSEDIKKDVSKTFKRMLTQNNKRTGQNSQVKGGILDDTNNESTKYEGSKYDHEVQTQISEIENKFAKKKKNFKHLLKNKMYKEDQLVEGEVEQTQGQKDSTDPQANEKELNLKQLEEFISTKRPKDPFLELKPLTEKVVINPKSRYVGSSQHEIFQQRFIQKDIQQRIEQNKFLKLPQIYQNKIDPDFNDNGHVQIAWLPYQQKVEMEAILDSSEFEHSDRSINDDDKCAQEQPYETPTSIGYRYMLKQIPIVELARRSDIVITSTLSQNLISKDKRLINDKFFALMNKKQLKEYIDELNSFKAMEKEIKYRSSRVRDKDKDYRDNYMKSFIHRSKFESVSLGLFKKGVMVLNSNKKKPVAKTKLVREAEKMKFEQNKRAAQKRGLPTFTRQDAQKLIIGEYHDDDEEEDELPSFVADDNKLEQEKAQMAVAHQLEQFENQLHKIFDQDDAAERKKLDEIPHSLRREFDLPQELNLLEIDFKEIRKLDATKKKTRPQWSGQDIIPDKLDHQKSLFILGTINEHRVWPLGLSGIWKRIRFVLRIHVKSDFFDNLMTFMVVLNTVTLSTEQHNQSVEFATEVEKFNTVFTYVFIYEMGTKLIAIGVKKYVDDKMNWLDGSVVLLSIFEIIYQKIQEGKGTNLSAFKTMRLFRTFRVFRIARLLRALESMQMILKVIATSYTSYIYITLLLFLFVFIFMLLGMQMFGGQMNYRDGLPRGNFDSPEIAFLTVFQILTMENWQTILFDLMRGETSKMLVSIYLIAWIFIGNFILLNLFLAILLDSFIEEEEEEEEFSVKQDRIKAKQLRAKERQQRKDRKKVYMNTLKKKKGMKNAAVPSKLYFGQAAEEDEEDLEDLDEEQIVKIFQSQGILKKTKKEIEDETILFDKIECAMSIYIFSQENKIRIFFYKLYKHKLWEQIVMGLILGSSLKLATDTYNKNIKSKYVLKMLEDIDLFFNYSFIVEMSVKIIAVGLVMDENSYLTDSWNQLDFFIVTSSIADMALAGFDLPFIRILRMLRVLRPLRFISRNIGLKMIVVALLESVGHIFNVAIVISMVYLVFAILGVNFMMGQMFYCSIDPYVLHTEPECLLAGGSWNRYDHNFDNVPQAYISLFVVSSLEGWPDVAIQALDTTKVDEGPKFQETTVNMLYFIIFILIGSFFLLNFFIGVLQLKFNQAQKEEQKGLTNKDMGWMDIQRLILQAEPEYNSTNVPKNVVRKYFHDLVSGDRFDLTIMTCIILNMIQMGCFAEGMSQSMIQFLDFTNIIFTIIFIIEATFKLIAYGGSYFENAWNKFDFFVVVSSLMDFVLGALDSSALDSVKALPQLARVLRVLRVTRLLKFAAGLQAIIQTIMFSIPSLANVFGLLMLIFFMFAVSGNFLFGPVLQGDVIGELKNFGDFTSAFILMFAVSTGEDWNKIMFDCSRTEEDGCIKGQTCGSVFSFVYFIVLVVMCTHVMLNLFILVIIQQFEKYYLPKDNMIVLFKRDLDSFMRVWKTETQDKYQCLKIKEKQLPKFFRVLGEDGDQATSLGFGQNYEEGELKKQMLKMAIKSDNGYIYFNELLYRCMRRKYGNMKINKKMQIFELLTQHSIYLMTLEIQKKGNLQLTNDDIKHALVKKENGVNPFLTVMNFKISFKTWTKQARTKIKQNEIARIQKEGHMKDAAALMDENEVKVASIPVEIDVETIFSATSEEDEVGDIVDGRTVTRSKSLAGGTDSIQGSALPSDRSFIRKKKNKSKDHLENFQRKMTSKFQESLVMEKMQSTVKKGINIDMEGVEARTLKASIGRSITKRQKQMNDLNTSSRNPKKNSDKKK